MPSSAKKRTKRAPAKTVTFAETNLEESLRVLLNESGMGITLVDLERKIRDVNPAFERLTGYTREELVGRTFAGILYPEDSPLNLELHRQLLAGERDVYHMERRYIRKDGSLLWTRLMVSMLRDADGKPHLTMGVIEDITEAKNAEAKLREQQAAIAQSSKMSALGELASGIAHEINNPLNVIQFRAQMIKQAAQKLGKGDGEGATTIVEHAENIERNVQRITSIVRGLRAFARKADQDPFEIVPVRRLLDEALELCQDKFRFANVDLKVVRPEEDLDVECRPTQLLQVLVNLLNNAFDAVTERPKDEKRWVRLEAVARGSAVEFAVTDSGPGIPEKVAEQIFTQFFTTKPAGKGTGLGLSISRKILDAHRGILKLDKDAPNTRFLVGLPRRQSDTYYQAVA
jgi:PAS domain S-box-containing protein